MKIIFLTNALTPHQRPLVKSFLEMTEVDFELIECMNIDRSNLPIGWKQTGTFDFVVPYEELMSKLDYYIDRIADADIVITGSAPDFLIKKRLKNKRITFKYSERIYKKKCHWYEIPLRAIKYYFKFTRYKSLYLLCASAYTAGDYAKTGTFLNRAFKWGYFPETKKYDIEKLIDDKDENSILWVGRIIDWKHPELAVEVAKRLKQDNFKFSLNIVGAGELENKIANLINERGLQNEVQLLGSMPPEEVRAYMEKSEIFLFTSDRQEGWGAVLNESMNSGCAVVANREIGAVPYLLTDDQNGYIYNDGNVQELYEKTKTLLENSEKRRELGIEAYKTIKNEWNAQKATEKFIELVINLANSKKINCFEKGVCSEAEILK